MIVDHRCPDRADRAGREYDRPPSGRTHAAPLMGGDMSDESTEPTCNCGPDCRCGCQEGNPCRCGGKKD